MEIGLVMATAGVVLAGVIAVALAIAWDAGALHIRRAGGRREAHSEPAGDSGKQCVATTADGSRCVRERDGRHPRYCWQHRRMAQQARSLDKRRQLEIRLQARRPAVSERRKDVSERSPSERAL